MLFHGYRRTTMLGLPLPRSFAAALASAVLLFIAFGASVTGAAAGELAERTRVFLEQQALPGGGELEVVVGDIDPRLSLAPCARSEPFIPPGAKLWGRATLGVRCVEGAAWTVYVPVQIKLYAPVQVAARPIPRGSIVAAGDTRLERLDLTQFPGGVFGADDAVEGKMTVRALAAGEPIKRDLVRAPRVVEPGDAVRVVYDGTTFAVTVDGKALSAAGDGESARVSVANGRVLTGVARPGKVVQVR
jgi:flagella basal body P-ring formation protein FlgA